MEDVITPRIEIDTESEILIRKAGRQYNSIAALFMLLSFAGLLIYTFRLRKYGFKYYADWYSIFNFTLVPMVFIGYLLLASLQVYYYYKAIKTQNLALYRLDQTLFGKSFHYYILGNRMTIICLGIYFFIDLIFIYQELNPLA